MHLVLVGLSHRTAPVDVRERVDFQGRLNDAVRALAARGSAAEAVVLSTCNRAELYAASDDIEQAKRELASFVAEFHGLDPAVVEPHVYALSDAEVARHLFRVAAGLDSLVVGEP